MEMCNICLQSNVNCLNLTEIEDWTLKLQQIVPELDWLKGSYTICLDCCEKIDQFIKFKAMCLENAPRPQEEVIVKVQTPKKYNCFNCDSSFGTKLNLLRHLQNVHFSVKRVRCRNKGDIQCDLCLKTYTTVKIMKTHRKVCGKPKTQTRTFSCEICGLNLNYAKLVVEHCVKIHEIPPKYVKPYSCIKCGHRFRSSANLTQHNKYHEGNRNHVCSFCGKSYITKSDLTVHEYTHLNRRNYKCEFCYKAFNTNKTLRTHNLVVHTDPSLWKWCCNVCEKRFPLKYGYEQHMRRHTGDKPFECHICCKKFFNQSELKRHFRFHTNEPQEVSACA